MKSSLPRAGGHDPVPIGPHTGMIILNAKILPNKFGTGYVAIEKQIINT